MPYLLDLCTNYIFLDTLYNTDSHSKISVGGNNLKNIYINYAITYKGVSPL